MLAATLIGPLATLLEPLYSAGMIYSALAPGSADERVGTRPTDESVKAFLAQSLRLDVSPRNRQLRDMAHVNESRALVALDD
jgi:hypothetical protein